MRVIFILTGFHLVGRADGRLYPEPLVHHLYSPFAHRRREHRRAGGHMTRAPWRSPRAVLPTAAFIDLTFRRDQGHGDLEFSVRV